MGPPIDLSFPLRIGQTGLGKSTLVNTIFASHLIDSKGRLTPNEPVRSTTEIQTVSHSMFAPWRMDWTRLGPQWLTTWL